MYFTQIPRLIQRSYPGLTWRKESTAKVLYLTFDDGPSPEVTPWVLDELARWDAKATFFWLGKQVQQYPELAHRVLDEKHSAGNHSYSHLNNWHTQTKAYLRDFLRGQGAIREYTGLSARLFRPPFGRISRPAARFIRRSHEIIMYDVVSGDFDLRLDSASVTRNVIRHAKPGSIVLMHDTPKAFPRLEEGLPGILSHFSDKGYTFEALSSRPRRPARLPEGLLI